ncbi:SSI family serine proteinase inhibitor [Streptomyces sp. NPDC050703]|uniref:SSI family serine proteinase inhibitor n=1 Tax=Streptomyces sp. NPDC050703 TaxID=3157218 RepID=UPI00342660B3
MLRRFLLTAAASAAALSAVPSAAQAASVPVAPTDRLTITVAGSGHADGTYVLDCHRTGGTHPQAKKACARLDAVTVYGKDPFAKTPPGTMCTMQYGGPATARVTGTWQGRPVNATYDRGDGCEISRWNHLVPVLPDVSARA